MIACKRQRCVQNAVNDELCSSRVRDILAFCVHINAIVWNVWILWKTIWSVSDPMSACLYACNQECILCWYSSSSSSFMSMMLLWSMLKCTYPCIHVCVCLHLCAFVCMCVSVCLRVCISLWWCARQKVCVCVCTCMLMWLCRYWYVCKLKRMSVLVSSITSLPSLLYPSQMLSSKDEQNCY